MLATLRSFLRRRTWSGEGASAKSPGQAVGGTLLAPFSPGRDRGGELRDAHAMRAHCTVLLIQQACATMPYRPRNHEYSTRSSLLRIPPLFSPIPPLFSLVPSNFPLFRLQEFAFSHRSPCCSHSRLAHFFNARKHGQAT